MPRFVWVICIAFSLAFSTLTLLAGWVGGHLDDSTFWFLWGFVSAYPISQLLGMKAATSIIDRLD
jgi:hypothetical protein